MDTDSLKRRLNEVKDDIDLDSLKGRFKEVKIDAIDLGKNGDVLVLGRGDKYHVITGEGEMLVYNENEMEDIYDMIFIDK